MADLRPFKALKPAPGLAEKIASPPYDVMNSSEAREMAAGNPMSFLHINKPEIDLPENTDPYDSSVYETGRKSMHHFMDSRWLQMEDKPCYYIYRQRMGDHVQTGLVAGASCEDYIQNKVKKHEHTRRDKEDDRTRHIEALNANTGPVFLTYPACSNIDSIISRLTDQKPEVDFISPDDVQHVLWTVDKPEDITALHDAFREIPALYVADGHHRSASAARVYQKRKTEKPDMRGNEPWCHFLAVVFPHDQMMIMDYNRVVFDLNGLSEQEFLNRVSEKFDVQTGDSTKPSIPRTYRMLLNGKWYTLCAKSGTFDPSDPVNGLDVSVLQNNLLNPVLGIEDPRSDKRIDFVGGIRGMGELEKRCNEGAAVAFALYPTTIEQLMAIADADEVMPPKSTWFEPKLRSGLIVKPLWE